MIQFIECNSLVMISEEPQICFNVFERFCGVSDNNLGKEMMTKLSSMLVTAKQLHIKIHREWYTQVEELKDKALPVETFRIVHYKKPKQ